MPTIVKTDSGTWKAVIRKTGFPTTTKTFRLKRDAEDWARTTEDEMVRGMYVKRAPAEKLLFADAIDRYLAEVTPSKRPFTQAGEKHRAATLKKHFGKYSLAGITAELVASQASIVLSDELEYGLEPHRIARFLGSLGAKEAAPLQAFLTTHSPVALRELSGGQLFVLRRSLHGHEARMVGTDNDTQSTIRLYPEAFLAGSVIVCEGASEIGLLRGLDLHRVEHGGVSLAAQGIAMVDCGGGEPDRPYARAAAFQSLGYRVMVVRDDDKKPTPAIEQTFLLAGGAVVAYRAGRALEDELFGSLTPVACQHLIKYAHDLHGDLIHEHLRTVSNNTLTVQAVWDEIQNTQALSVPNRAMLGQAARIRKAGWFKSISWMEDVARTIVAPDLPLCDPGFKALVDQVSVWAAHGPR